MTRPPRRKSSLHRLSPTDPASQPPEREDEAAATTTPPAPASPAVSAPAPQAAASAGERRKYRHKVSFYQDEDDTARVRAAIQNTFPTEGPRSLSEFINQAVMAEVRRLEERYNDGEPWPGVGARELPQGRPMGR